jgi:hypothetical protein
MLVSISVPNSTKYVVYFVNVNLRFYELKWQCEPDTHSTELKFTTECFSGSVFFDQEARNLCRTQCFEVMWAAVHRNMTTV